MDLRKSLILALILTIGALALWENYCRESGFIAAVEGDKALWAEHRDRLRNNDPQQVLLVSASRGHFDFQLNEWEEITGNRPIQLGAGGRGSGAVFQDIVENTEFSGTIIINVTPGLFFVPPADSVFGWRRGKAWVDYYYDRTYAQRLNQNLSYLLQPYFAFLTSDMDGDPDLRSLIERIKIPGSVKSGPPFPRFANVDADRNTTMMDRVVTDTAYAGVIQRVWTHNYDSINRLADAKPIIFQFYYDLLKKFKDRGGLVVFTRNPSHGGVRAHERQAHPRRDYWDLFIADSGCSGYHFEDYPQLSQFFTPEWSHLSTPDAKKYTKEILKIMQKDKVL